MFWKTSDGHARDTLVDNIYHLLHNPPPHATHMRVLIHRVCQFLIVSSKKVVSGTKNIVFDDHPIYSFDTSHLSFPLESGTTLKYVGGMVVRDTIDPGWMDGWQPSILGIFG